MPDDIRGPSLISSEQADILSRWSTVEVGFERKAPPYLSYRSYFAYFFRTMEPPIAGPARFPDLFRLFRLFRTFLQPANTERGQPLPAGAT